MATKPAYSIADQITLLKQRGMLFRNESGRYKNVSEGIRSKLRLLEDEESKNVALRKAIQEGIDSGIAHDFDPKKHLQ